MESSPSASTTERRAQRRLTWFTLLAATAFCAVQFSLEQLPEAGLAEWSFAAVTGIGGAAALLWSKRYRPWYWAALTAIAAMEIGLLLLQNRSGLPSPMGKGLLLATLVSAGATGAVLLWMRWLFDPHEAPRTSASRTVEIVIYGLAVIGLGMVGTVYWAIHDARAKQARLARVVLVRQSQAPFGDLLDCFDPQIRGQTSWTVVPGRFSAERSYDEVRAVATTVTDEGPQRSVSFTTLRGRALTVREMKKINTCLGTATPVS